MGVAEKERDGEVLIKEIYAELCSRSVLHDFVDRADRDGRDAAGTK